MMQDVCLLLGRDPWGLVNGRLERWVEDLEVDDGGVGRGIGGRMRMRWDGWWGL